MNNLFRARFLIVMNKASTAFNTALRGKPFALLAWALKSTPVFRSIHVTRLLSVWGTQIHPSVNSNAR